MIFIKWTFNQQFSNGIFYCDILTIWQDVGIAVGKFWINRIYFMWISYVSFGQFINVTFIMLSHIKKPINKLGFFLEIWKEWNIQYLFQISFQKWFLYNFQILQIKIWMFFKFIKILNTNSTKNHKFYVCRQCFKKNLLVKNFWEFVSFLGISWKSI